MACLGAVQRREIRDDLVLERLPVPPVRAPLLPQRTQPFLMGHGVLDDDCRHPLRMCQGETEADRAAVVLHEENVSGQPELFGEPIDDRSEMIEGVIEARRIGRVAVAEAWIIGRDDMLWVCQMRKQSLEHARR